MTDESHKDEARVVRTGFVLGMNMEVFTDGDIYFVHKSVSACLEYLRSFYSTFMVVGMFIVMLSFCCFPCIMLTCEALQMFYSLSFMVSPHGRG